MKMHAPPRQTPVSIRSPGTSSAMICAMQSWMLVIRRRPIIDSAREGQSSPLSRSAWS